MQSEKIHQKLDEMLSNPKSKSFLNHLVRAYLPVNKTDKVWDKPEGTFKCVLTNKQLISVSEVMEGIQTEEFKSAFMANLKNWASEEQRVERPMEKFLNGRVLGFTGKDTTTYMSQEAFQIFYDWVVTKLLSGDKHIGWLLSTTRREAFLKRAEAIADNEETINALNRIKKSTNDGKRATTKLGDLDALQVLKAKMEASEKDNK
jgi:hypothetical protein